MPPAKGDLCLHSSYSFITCITQAADIKSHSFFKGVKWDKMLELAMPPPFVPDVDGPCSLKYVRPKYLEQVCAPDKRTVSMRLVTPCSRR